LGGWAIFGIVIACLAFLAIAFFLFKRWRNA
jgi:hypothetical protein